MDWGAVPAAGQRSIAAAPSDAQATRAFDGELASLALGAANSAEEETAAANPSAVVPGGPPPNLGAHRADAASLGSLSPLAGETAAGSATVASPFVDHCDEQDPAPRETTGTPALAIGDAVLSEAIVASPAAMQASEATQAATEPPAATATATATASLCNSAAFLRGASAPPGERLSLALDDAEIGAALKAFAGFTGLNMLISPSIKGRVSLRLADVPWCDAFQALLDAHGLRATVQGGVLWLAPAAEVAARERARHDALARDAAVEPLASRIFSLRYQRAALVRDLLVGAGAQRMVSGRGAVTADERTNQLFVTDVPARLAQVAAMLLAVDRPVKQVLIEARIVEAEDGFSRDVGMRLFAGAAGGAASSGGAEPGEKQRDGAAPRHQQLQLPNGVSLQLPATPNIGAPAAAVALTLLRSGVGALLSLELSALEADGRGRVLSHPRIVTADRAKAVIEQGSELPYQTKIRNGVSGVQFRKASLRLEVTPHVMPGDKVSLQVDVSKDSIGAATDAGLAINTKHVSTVVEIDSGGTVAIGGILKRDTRNDVARVPVLGSLPLVGALFRRTTRSTANSELIVFLTPTVVHADLADSTHSSHATDAGAAGLRAADAGAVAGAGSGSHERDGAPRRGAADG